MEETRKTVIVSNIRIEGYTSKVIVPCPDCSYRNTYFVHSQSRFIAERLCKECGAILMFDMEEVKEVKNDRRTKEN